MLPIQSFWYGKSLSPMEQLSICSYLRRGHPFHLYVYEAVDWVPAGVEIKDAQSIIPLHQFDPKNFPHLALFSDFFRYKLLLEKGGWWSDTDSVCLKPFDFAHPYVFSSEDRQDGLMQANGGVIKIPAPNTDIMKHCWARCLETDIHNISWGAVGPRLMNEAIFRHHLQAYIQPPYTFCPLPWWEVRRYEDPNFKLNYPESHAIHLWNAMWSSNGMDKSKIPQSLLEEG
jgi:mannosyltransferase OCH1-like enzyme